MKITKKCRQWHEGNAEAKKKWKNLGERFFIFILFMLLVMQLIFGGIYVLKMTEETEYNIWLYYQHGSDEHISHVYCDMASDKQFEKYIAFSCSDKKVIEFRKDEEDSARWVMQAYTAEQ
ncbi:TPA: hypothetical protein LVM22_001195 [Klebsiella oxytoca]|nr:hypothetical protein [Klebsiella oxytoca]